MKSFFSIFFTMPVKGFFFISIFVLSLFFSQCSIDYFSLYSKDRDSFVNVITQGDSFNYESSHYFKRTVETTVEEIMELCFEYEEIFDGSKNENSLLSHFGNIGDLHFAEIHNHLSSMEGFHFALVNHTKGKIYSDIQDLNGTYSIKSVKRFFSSQGPNQFTVHTCQNPYFATNNFISFAEFIRKTAAEYEDSFDLYITFGSEEYFNQTKNECEQLHKAMRQRMEKLNNTALIYVLAIALAAAAMLCVTGKQEPGGKTYPTVINKLPNDFIALLYGIVLVCQISLYRTTLSMLISHGNELDTFWFTHSSNFYVTRVRFCTVVFICAATNLLCILKREYKMGLLIKNTYIYSIVTMLKNKKKSDENDENHS